MTMADHDAGRVSLPSSEAAAAAARRQLATYLRALDVHEGAIDDVSVVVSELVTNAVRHAADGPDATVHVEWLLRSPRLLLQVGDVARTPRQDLHDQGATGGRGLAIVSALAESLSLVHTDRGTTVTVSITVA